MSSLNCIRVVSAYLLISAFKFHNYKQGNMHKRGEENSVTSQELFSVSMPMQARGIYIFTYYFISLL